MSFGFSAFQEGYFTSTGAAKALDLGRVPHCFELINITQAGASGATQKVKNATYFKGMSDGTALVVRNTASAATDETSLLSTGGFSAYDGSVDQPGTAVTITSISQANPAVVTATAHGLAVGDKVRIINATGMNQISGMAFEVLTVPTANTFTIPLNSSGFAAAASGGSLRKLPVPAMFAPGRKYITAISQANPGVITTSVSHGLVTGQEVRLHVPTKFGMTQLEGQQVAVTVLSTTTFSIGVDTSAYTAFAFPASGAVPFTFAEVIPFGETTNALDDAVRNVAFKGMVIGTSVVGVSGDLICWRAKYSDQLIVG